MIRERIEIPHEIFFNKSDGFYHWRSADGTFLRLKREDVTRRLRRLGYSSKALEGAPLSQVDEILLRVQDEMSVIGTGPLAGYRVGKTRLQSGEWFLVTHEFRLIEPKEGGHPTIDRILAELLGNAPIQIECLKHWLSIAYQSLRDGDFRPGQSLFLVGPPNSGKSFLQSQIITPTLGGRAAMASDFITGESRFTGEMGGCEHLLVEDDAYGRKNVDRTRTKDKHKELSSNSSQKVEEKGRPAISVKLNRRTSCSANENPEAIRVLPMLDDDIRDKILFFRCETVDFAEMEFDTSTSEGRRKLVDTIERELPAFIHHLLLIEVPPHLRCPRFGVKAYINPYVEALLNESSSEEILWDWIERCEPLWVTQAGKETERTIWKGTASDLRMSLLHHYDADYTARNFLSSKSPSIFGRMLGKLARMRPDYVRECRSGESRDWEISRKGFSVVEKAARKRGA